MPTVARAVTSDNHMNFMRKRVLACSAAGAGIVTVTSCCAQLFNPVGRRRACKARRT